MTKICLMLLLLCHVAGCGTSKNVRKELSGRPQSITESAYTSKQCINKIKTRANELNAKVSNVVVDSSMWKMMLWPFVKGTTCMADID